MTMLTLGRYHPVLFSVVALLTACGGSQSPDAVVPASTGARYAASGGITFHYTGAKQSFDVPPGVRQITVVARGGAGGGSGGRGGRVYAVVAVRPAVSSGDPGSATSAIPAPAVRKRAEGAAAPAARASTKATMDIQASTDR
jgi:hypothetical protein